MSQCFLYDRCRHIDCDKPFCIRREKLERLYDMALLTEKQRKHIALSLDPENKYDVIDRNHFIDLDNLSNNILDFVNSGKNLYLHSSNTGNGKTSWSLRFIEKYFDKIWPSTDITCRALFISVPRFLIALKKNLSQEDTYAQYILDNIYDADLVVWDDIGTKIGTAFEKEQLYTLIDYRVEGLGKSNIYTSNLTSTELNEALDQRLSSRICNKSIDIELFGTDKRVWSVGGETH